MRARLRPSWAAQRPSDGPIGRQLQPAPVGHGLVLQRLYRAPGPLQQEPGIVGPQPHDPRHRAVAAAQPQPHPAAVKVADGLADGGAHGRFPNRAVSSHGGRAEGGGQQSGQGLVQAVRSLPPEPAT
jgi:hypothetical protein